MTGHDFQPSADSSASQCARLLAALLAAPVTTADARRLLGLSSSPAARVLQLRRDGHDIVTVTEMAGGSRCARYVLATDAAQSPTVAPGAALAPSVQPDGAVASAAAAAAPEAVSATPGHQVPPPSIEGGQP